MRMLLVLFSVVFGGLLAVLTPQSGAGELL